jgi:hypothetical protein
MSLSHQKFSVAESVWHHSTPESRAPQSHFGMSVPRTYTEADVRDVAALRRGHRGGAEVIPFERWSAFGIFKLERLMGEAAGLASQRPMPSSSRR